MRVLAQRRRVPGLLLGVMDGRASLLERRVLRLMDKRMPWARRWQVAAVFGCLAVLVVCAGGRAQQKQTMREFFEDLNAKAAAGQPLPAMTYEGPYADTQTVSLAELQDAAPAIRAALTHDSTMNYGTMMLVGISLRQDALRRGSGEDLILVQSQQAMEQAISHGSLFNGAICLPYMHLVQVDHIYSGAPVLEAYLQRSDAIKGNGGGACFAHILLSMRPIPPDADEAVAKFIERKDQSGGGLADMTNAVANTQATSAAVVRATVALIHDARVNQYFMQEMGRQPQIVRDGVRQELMRAVQDESASTESRDQAKRFLEQMDAPHMPR